MQYQLAQDTLTWLFSSVTLTSLLTFFISYDYVASSHYKQQNSPVQTPQNREQRQPQQNLWGTQQKLKQSQQELQEAQQSLEQVYQANLQMQIRLDAVSLELQQAKHEVNQCQEERRHLHAQLSLAQKQFQQTQEELEKTRQGVQGVVNQLFCLDRNAKLKFNNFFNQKNSKAMQVATE